MTELEACVLALLWRQGPMTAYQVRKEFERSPTSSWRASTGSIYPLIRRLRREGLVETEAVSTDARRTTRLTASSAGQAQVGRWLAVVPPWAGDATEDPIRTRVLFLDFLDSAAASAAVADMHEATVAALARMDEFIATSRLEPLEKLAVEGARAMLVVRRDWLLEVRDFVARHRPFAAGDEES